MHYNNYTDDQKDAITSTESCVLLTGGAGTGKTHVLVERIYYLVQRQGLKPQQILMISSSYNDLYNIGKKLDELMDASNVAMFTLEMFALKIILDLEGYDKVFLDKKAINKIKQDVIESSFNSKKQYEAYMKMPKVFPNQTSIINEMFDKYLVSNNIMPETDYINYALTLLEKNPLIMHTYINQYSHVFIDNAQDYDGDALKFIEKFTNNSQNFFVLGNEDQILQNISFEQTYLYKVYTSDHFKHVQLKDNYKNSKSIMKLSTLIKENSSRMNADMMYMVEDHYRPYFKLFKDNIDIQKMVSKEVSQLLKSEHEIEPQDIVILTSKTQKQFWVDYYKTSNNRHDNEFASFKIDSSVFKALSEHQNETIERHDFFKQMLALIKTCDISQSDENTLIGLISMFLRQSKTIDIKSLILFLHLKVYKQIFDDEHYGIQVLTIQDAKGLDFKNVFIPSVRDLLTDDLTHSRRLLYNALFTAKDFVYLFDLEGNNHPVLEALKRIVDNWNSVYVKRSVYKNIIKSSNQTLISLEIDDMFQKILVSYERYPKLHAELKYLIEVVKHYDQILSDKTKPQNIDIYMQAFRYFIQHTLKVTMDEAFGDKRNKIAAYFQGGSAGNFNMDRDYKYLITNNLLDKSFSLNEFKGIHDVYRYLSATHHKNDHDRSLTSKEIKQAKKNIDIFRKFSHREKIKAYVAVIKLYHALKLDHKALLAISAEIE